MAASLSLEAVKRFGYDRNMASIVSIAEIAFLIGDPARANMLFTLKDSGMASAGDLTRAAGVAPSTASEHLAKLIDAGLVTVTRAGRVRYFRLAHPMAGDVLEAVENLAGVLAPDGPAVLRHDRAALHARACGDHLAGRLGVALADTWFSRGYLRRAQGTLTVSQDGGRAFADLGIDLGALRAAPRKLVSLCHDWSEDAVHLGGALGGALLRGFVERDWMRRDRGAQSVAITPRGSAELRARFGIDTRLPGTGDTAI